MKTQLLRLKGKLSSKKGRSKKFGRRADQNPREDQLLITFQSQKLNLLAKTVEEKVQSEKFI